VDFVTVTEFRGFRGFREFRFLGRPSYMADPSQLLEVEKRLNADASTRIRNFASWTLWTDTSVQSYKAKGVKLWMHSPGGCRTSQLICWRREQSWVRVQAIIVDADDGICRDTADTWTVTPTTVHKQRTPGECDHNYVNQWRK